MSKTLTVKELREGLATMPDDMPVRVWLPGSRIYLTQVFKHTGPTRALDEVLIEGNLEPGSALS